MRGRYFEKSLDNIGFIPYNMVENKNDNIEENRECRSLKSFFTISLTGVNP